MNPELVVALSTAVSFVWQRCHAVKSYGFFLKTLERLIRSVYEGNLGGDFKSILNALVDGQVKEAYQQAWKDADMEGDVAEYLYSAAQADIGVQQGFIDQLYRDIVDARVDKTSIDPLLSRAALWANKWNESYSNGVMLIASANGEKLMWMLGETEEHCPTCVALNGKVAYAREWDELGVKPQGAPNKYLSCGGWRCDCQRVPTKERRTSNAKERIAAIVGK